MRGLRLVLAVNLGAVAVAVVAFGLWQQSQSLGMPAGTGHPKGFYELTDDVGYIPKANAEMTDRSEANGRVIYSVTYNSGPDHFRVVPAAPQAEACVLLFGDSFTFGTGVGNDETFAAQIVKQSGGKVAAHNFGIAGWGPHQFLAGLQSGRFQRAAQCKVTDAVFLMIPSLIWRTAGVTNPWDTNGPRFHVTQDGRPMRNGKLGADAYNWRRWLGLNAVSEDDAAWLATAVIVEAMAELRRDYPGIKTHFISYRVPSWTDTDLSPGYLARFEDNLQQQAGIIPLPLDAIIPKFRFMTDQYTLAPNDSHPNARAHRLIAAFILREMKEP